MNLFGLLASIQEIPSYNKLVKELKIGSDKTCVFALDVAKPYLVVCLHHDLGLPALVLTARPERARELYEEISAWCDSDALPWFFPEPDALPYERLSSDPYVVQQRMRVMAGLSGKLDTPLIISSAHAIWRKTVSVSDFASSRHVLRKSMKINLEQMLARWVSLGYEVENTVELPGAVSRRGGILDIYPTHSDLPARIELFGDEVESIRLFDPASQRSIEQVAEIEITPARELVISENRRRDIGHFLDLSTLNDGARDRVGEEIGRLARGQWFDGIESYASMVNSGTLLDYMPAHSVVILDQPDLIESELQSLEAQAIDLRRGHIERGELPKNFPTPYFVWSELVPEIDKFDLRMDLDHWGDGERGHIINFNSAPSFSGQITMFIEGVKEIIEGGSRLIIVSQQAARLAEILEEQDIFTVPVKNIEQIPPPSSVTLVQGLLAGGWVVGGDRHAQRLRDIRLH
ncbi:hypothetical protein ACFLU2_00295 [Chloroflexota bacterium]